MNLDLDSACDRLFSGVNICVSNAAGIYTPTTIAGATATATSIYASSTVTPPGPVATGTTRNCGKYYMAESGDTCHSVSLNITIDSTLFLKINPELNAGCTNLVAGEYYCVLPIANWNVTATQIVPALAPTTSGAKTACYNWHTVQSGEYCALIENQYGVNMAQLQQCNPALLSDCSNLELGAAYETHFYDL